MNNLHTDKTDMLPVTEILRFCTQDGPGIRTTVFVKGCPMRCLWCHNPETQSLQQQIFFTLQLCHHCGTCIDICPTHAHRWDLNHIHGFDGSLCSGCLKCVEACPFGALEPVARSMSARDILREVARDRAFFGSLGGLTISGGEPCMFPDAILALLRMSKDNGISTAIETSGFFDERYLSDLVSSTDLFLWDFKDGDNDRHIRHTGVSNHKSLNNLYKADALGATIILRTTLVKGMNMDDTHLKSFARVASSLKNLSGCELLAYHPFGGAKKIQLGLPDDSHKEWIPSPSEMQESKNRLLQFIILDYNEAT